METNDINNFYEFQQNAAGKRSALQAQTAFLFGNAICGKL